MNKIVAERDWETMVKTSYRSRTSKLKKYDLEIAFAVLDVDIAGFCLAE